MDQLNSFADNRLVRDCIFCGGPADTRDHIPSKCLLDKPYPQNLPVVGCCETCNNSFSRDEQYFACFIACVRAGSTDPEKIERSSISKILRDSPALRKRIEDAMTEVDGQLAFVPETERINNVMMKLAQGHVAFELNLMLRDTPDHFWYGLLSSLPEKDRDTFHSVHEQHNVGEIGSRSMQRLQVMTLSMLNGEQKTMIINDWIYVQEGRYRYIAIHDMGMIIIRIVIDEFFACEVAWNY